MADEVENKTKSDTSLNMPSGLPYYSENYVDHSKNRYPFCIVWTPIPMLTYVLVFLVYNFKLESVVTT